VSGEVYLLLAQIHPVQRLLPAIYLSLYVFRTVLYCRTLDTQLGEEQMGRNTIAAPHCHGAVVDGWRAYGRKSHFYRLRASQTVHAGNDGTTKMMPMQFIAS
jgi:hypothetical protein